MTAPAEKLQQFLQGYKAELRAAARQALAEPLPPLTEELFALYEQTGSRLEYENAYFARRRALAVLGLCAVLEQRETGRIPAPLLAGLCGVLRAVCAEECWALPAHVDRAAGPGWRATVDLFAAETAQTLAELAGRLGDALPAPLAAQIRAEAERRVLRPYFGTPAPYRSWEFAANNWNAVCAGAIGSACLWPLRGQPERAGFLQGCLDRVCASLPRYLDSFSADGACLEGLTYYTYGMTYFVNFAQELLEYDRAAGNDARDLLRGAWGVEEAGRGGDDGGSKSLEAFRAPGRAHGTGSVQGAKTPAAPSDLQKLARIAEFLPLCFFADGKTINFSDAFDNERFRAGLACALAMRFEGLPLPELSRAAGLHSDPCYRFAALRMDLLTTGQFLAEQRADGAGPLSEHSPKNGIIAAAENERQADSSAAKKAAPCGAQEAPGRPAGTAVPAFHILPDAEWCVGQAMGSRGGAGFACKGGANSGSHNHNDIGHFIYEANGVTFLADLGLGEYTREYLGPRRYETLCCSSFGHSVPVIGGQGQCAGEGYRCTGFAAQENGRVRMELQAAYPAGLVKRLTRMFAFDLADGRLQVRDLFEQPAGPVEENLITQIRPQITPHGILLEQNGAAALLQIEAAEPGEGAGEEKPARPGKEAKNAGAARPPVNVLRLTHRNHAGQDEPVYAIRWELPLLGGQAAGGFCIRYLC